MNARQQQLWDSGKWFLRATDRGISHGGYKRNRVGVWNDAPRWTGTPTCEACGGYFGIDRDVHSFGLLLYRPTIELCEWRGKRVVIDGDKICVSSYRVIACNSIIAPEFFAACGYQVARDGDTISPIPGARWLMFGGHVTVSGQTGGYWSAYESSRQTVSGQTGGDWSAFGSSRQTVSGQTGGDWSAYESSRWRAYGSSRQTVSGQTGGYWCAYESSRQTVRKCEEPSNGHVD